MTITAEIIEDSISPEGVRLTTMRLRYPRFIHAEFMTHRVFSRNASSSRAIPVKRMIEDLRRDPAMPVYWGAAQKGMQAGAELTGDYRLDAEAAWLSCMEQAIIHAERMMEFGLHKQIANRVLEPWAHINVVVTATEWDNFFALRRHADAQPEIKVLADTMHDAMQGSIPRPLERGDWHLPFVTGFERGYNPIVHLRALSVARCARVSYMTHDGLPPSIDVDLKLYKQLVGSTPLHASPAEHQATPDTQSERFDAEGEEIGVGWDMQHEHGNLRGWRQFRRMLPGGIV